MEVLIAEKLGFCAGVKNAIKLAEKTIAEQKNVFSLGPIIHNKDVEEHLSEGGLKTVEMIDNIAGGTVIIRSHGATPEELEKIHGKGLKIVDATCVLVKRVQKIAEQLSSDGYKVVIIGDRNHPEVQAVVGFAGDVDVVANEKDLSKLPKNKKLGVICQTTQSPDHFGRMVGAIVKSGFAELKVINTLCSEAIKRQQSAIDLCKKVDVMFVLGGLNSANTRKLAELCKKYNNLTFHLQNFSELDTNTLRGKARAGVTAGASTPDWIIDEFVNRLRAFDSGKI